MRHIYFLLLMAFAASAGAENLFVDGAKWVEQGESYPEGVAYPFEHVYTIEGTDEWLGEPCLRLYLANGNDESTKHLATLLRVDGDKVYFMNSTEDSDWTLLYDFGLEIGESCEVGQMPSDWTKKSTVTLDRVTCVDKITSEKYNRPAMVMRSGESEIEESDGIWLTGIGSDQGLNCNCRYSWSADMWSELKEMSVGDRVIFSLPGLPEKPGAINGIAADSTTQTQLYNLHGIKVERHDAPGIYIEVRGRDARKIIVR